MAESGRNGPVYTLLLYMDPCTAGVVDPLMAMAGPVRRGPDAASAQPAGDKAAEAKPAVAELHMGETVSELPMQVDQVEEAQSNCTLMVADIGENRITDIEMEREMDFPLKEKKSQSKGNKQAKKSKNLWLFL